MSLISEALKKVQKEREDLTETRPMPVDGSEPPEPPRRGLNINKRVIFYGGLGIVVIVAVVLALTLTGGDKKSSMQALNVRSKPPAPGQQMKPASEMPPSQPKPQEEPKPQAQTDPEKPAPVQVKKQEPVKATPPAPKPKPKENLKPQRKPESKPKPRQTPRRKQIKKIKPLPQKPVTKDTATGAAAQMRRGNALLNQKNYGQAVEAYKEALAIEKSAETYLKLYAAFKGMKNKVLMRAYIEDGLKHFPEDFYLNKISAILSIRAKDYRKALISTERALQKNATDYTLYTYQGLSYFHGKQYKNALTAFQKSLDINSDAIENYYYMGLIYDNMKEYQKAYDYYNVFFKLNPDSENFKHREWIVRRMRTLQQYLGR